MWGLYLGSSVNPIIKPQPFECKNLLYNLILLLFCWQEVPGSTSFPGTSIINFIRYFTDFTERIRSYHNFYITKVTYKEHVSTFRGEVKQMIKVFIEQDCQPGKEAQFRDMLMERRDIAMRQRGYISGETLRELINPSHFKIISTWSTLEDWKTWQGSPQRLLIEEMMESMTDNGRKLYIFTVDHGS